MLLVVAPLLVIPTTSMFINVLQNPCSRTVYIQQYVHMATSTIMNICIAQQITMKLILLCVLSSSPVSIDVLTLLFYDGLVIQIGGTIDALGQFSLPLFLAFFLAFSI